MEEKKTDREERGGAPDVDYPSISVHVHNYRTTTVSVYIGLAHVSVASEQNHTLLVPVEPKISVALIDDGHAEALYGELQAKKHRGIGVPFPPSLYRGKFLQFVAEALPDTAATRSPNPVAIKIMFKEVVGKPEYILCMM